MLIGIGADPLCLSLHHAGDQFLVRENAVAIAVGPFETRLHVARHFLGRDAAIAIGIELLETVLQSHAAVMATALVAFGLSCADCAQCDGRGQPRDPNHVAHRYVSCFAWRA